MKHCHKHFLRAPSCQGRLNSLCHSLFGELGFSWDTNDQQDRTLRKKLFRCRAVHSSQPGQDFLKLPKFFSVGHRSPSTQTFDHRQTPSSADFPGTAADLEVLLARDKAYYFAGPFIKLPSREAFESVCAEALREPRSQTLLAHP